MKPQNFLRGALPRTPPLAAEALWGSAPDPTQNHLSDVLGNPDRARSPKSLCDFGDMTPHTIVGGRGAQTTLTARASVRLRADRRNDPREALGPRGDTQSRPPGALDRCAGVTGAVRTARNTRHHSWSSALDHGRERVNTPSMTMLLDLSLQ